MWRKTESADGRPQTPTREAHSIKRTKEIYWHFACGIPVSVLEKLPMNVREDDPRVISDVLGLEEGPPSHRWGESLSRERCC
jgi:hypothetical protein